MNAAFEVHMLNDQGKGAARQIANGFDELLSRLEILCPAGREMAIVRTKLEEDCFYAKKAMASRPENQTALPSLGSEPREISVEELHQIARTMFEAYNRYGPNAGKTHDGKPVPEWKDLGSSVQMKWAAAALGTGFVRLPPPGVGG